MEIELQINSKELPIILQDEHKKLVENYDKVIIEKVFAYNQKPVYEFYCYKGQQVQVFEF